MDCQFVFDLGVLNIRWVFSSALDKPKLLNVVKLLLLRFELSTWVLDMHVSGDSYFLKTVGV